MLVIRDLARICPGPLAALHGVDLEIGKGMFGLLGPNGAGKTTLMRIVAGLLEPTAGSVLLNGDDAVAHPERNWARLGYLPQEFGFYACPPGIALSSYDGWVRSGPGAESRGPLELERER